jgi:hypothetical protein
MDYFSLADVLCREASVHTIQLFLLLQLETVNCSLVMESWVVTCKSVSRICSITFNTKDGPCSPKATCRYYSIFCVVSLPKLHSMLPVSVSLLACRTVKAVPQVQRGILTVRFTSRTDFQRTRLQNSEVGTPSLYTLLINMGIDMGHDARLVSGFDRGLMGRGQVIQKLQDPSGRLVWAAGSDLRADGHAAAQI